MNEPANRIDADRLKTMEFPAGDFVYDETRTMLYGLAAGMGRDPLDGDELPFVAVPPLRALPSMATVVAWDDTWLPMTGIDVSRVVHGEQRITLHKPLPAAATVRSALRIVDVFDKGEGRGAVLYVRTELTDLADDSPLATLDSTVFARGDGGFGGPQGNPPPLSQVPDREPDETVHYAGLPNQALIYRLLGDYNPIHSDPDFARSVGFDKPILHGLCTYAIATRALVKAVCDHHPERARHIEARFTAPVYPGETIATQIWRDAKGASFRSLVPERDTVVLDRGRIELR